MAKNSHEMSVRVCLSMRDKSKMRRLSSQWKLPWPIAVDGAESNLLNLNTTTTTTTFSNETTCSSSSVQVIKSRLHESATRIEWHFTKCALQNSHANKQAISGFAMHFYMHFWPVVLVDNVYAFSSK